MWPCLWTLTLGSGGVPTLPLLGIFAFGSIVMRSAGCIYNDWVDRDLDRQVERTRTRPLAQGSVSLPLAGLAFGTLLLMGAGLGLCLPRPALGAGLIAALAVIPYPWLKRVTFFPQVYLGLIFNSGVWVAWLTVRPLEDLTSPLPLRLNSAGFLWTLVYDTLYAYQDAAGDAKAGARSLALWLGDNPRPFLLTWSVGMVLCLLGVFSLQGLHPGGWVGLALTSLYGYRLLRQTNPQIPLSCLRFFQHSQWIGLGITLSLILGHS